MSHTLKRCRSAERRPNTPLILVLVLLGLPCRRAGAGESPHPSLAFDDAGSIQAWSTRNGQEYPGATCRLDWEAMAGRGNAGCLALHYSFKGGGRYVEARLPLPPKNTYRVARLWLNKPGAHRITFRVVDAQGQSFQKSTDFPGGDWQQVEVNLATWAMHYGGRNDGKIQFPLSSFAVLIENTADHKEGALQLDDLEWFDNPLDGGQPELGRYEALADTTWHPGGGEGNSWLDNTWRFRFNPGQQPMLHGNFSMLTSPTHLNITVESDGSGHAVIAHMASHFQHFQRELGRLTQKGEQTLDAPLDDLSTWQHQGGENDGERRLPLRLVGFQLQRREGGPAEGELRVKRLEIGTRYTADEAIILIPSVRQEGDSIKFSIVIRNLRAHPGKGRLVTEIRSIGQRIRQEVTDLEVASGASINRSFEQPARGVFMDATFRWEEAGASAKPANVGWVSTPDENPDFALNPSSPIGAGLYLYRWRGHPQAIENMNRVAELARRAGVKWSREEMQWAVTEPKEGQFDWSFYDQMLEVATQHGISVYGLLAYWSSWARINTEKGVEQYCRWARQIVRHYKGRIRHWEIWNEPNIFFWSGPKELYAKLLTKAYDAIKAEDPTAVVLGCSTAGVDQKFIKNVIDWGGKFDALTIHPYRGVLEERGYIQELQKTKELVDGRPVWITEIGFPSQLLTGFSERNQASLVARTYLASLASGAVESISWYDFRNDGTDPFYNEENFGLVRNDLTPKPGYRALATIGRLLGKMHLAGPVELKQAPSNAYAFRFTDGTSDVVAVCTQRSGAVLSSGVRPGMSIRDAMGAEIPFDSGRPVATVTLDAGFPIYISGPSPLNLNSLHVFTAQVTPSTARPGRKIQLHIGEIALDHWEVPYGWSDPVAKVNGLFELIVPNDTPPGTYSIQAVTGGSWRVPVTMAVRPALIRI